jgi:orotate phosphoribosyltransferase
MRFQCFDTRQGEELALHLLKIDAIKLNPGNPFTWASGWKSPIYCDNRLSLSFPKIRTLVKNLMVDLIQREYSDCEAIAGVATAGIPQGVLIADALELPFLYVRSKSKGHGLQNLIEGKAKSGQKVVVIEDLVSTGGSSLAAVDALRDAEINVLGMASIFTYGFENAKKNFERHKVDLFYLSEYEIMIKAAINNGYVAEDSKKALDSWRIDPSTWSGV